MCKTKAPRAFSLTELLVVVAILALLIALLITGIAAVQRTGRVTKCLSNQRQIALACASYASSNAGRQSIRGPRPRARPASRRQVARRSRTPPARATMTSTPGRRRSLPT
ncbi:MAG: prepilin-type N-terminal cleavage/methylation domain-containing protein [Planctomycetota bacterium]